MSGKQITATAVAAGAVLVGPLLLTLGVLHQQPANSLAGAAVTMTAIALFSLFTVRRWVTSTAAERGHLALAQRDAQDEQARFFAARAALESEHQRLHRDLEAERVAVRERLQVERKAMDEAFEERRAQLISETMDATFRMIRNGEFAPNTPRATVIEFPQQHPEPAREVERSRDRGVVGP